MAAIRRKIAAMRALRYAGIALGGLVALVVTLLLAVWLFVNPNDYKDRIAASVKSTTGRDLALPGDIKLSIFPWLALQIGPATLGNPPGFGSEPFAVVQLAALRVKLLPLLQKQIQVGRIEIDGLDLRLKRGAAGKGNWEDFAKGPEPANSQSPSQPLDLAGITVKNSRVAYDEMVAENIDLDVGHVATGSPIAVKLRLDLITAKGAKPLPLAGTFDVTPDASGERFRFAPLALDGRLTSDTGGPDTAWKFSAPTLDLDIAAQTLSAGRFDTQLASAQVSGQLTGTKIIDAPDLQGKFVLQPVALRDLMTALGVAAPVTRDASVLSRLSASGAFGYAKDAASAKDLKVQLDETSLVGSFAMNLDTSAMDFDLKLDRIDLDRYLPPPTVEAKGAAKKKQPFELPTQALKPLRARGSLAIGQAKFTGIALANLSVGVDAKDGITHVAPAKAQLYGGQYVGDITVDGRASTPSVKIEQTMTGIDVAKLLNDFAETRRLSGKGNVTTSLTARGRNSDELMKTLNGKAGLSLADGAVEGVDVWFAIAQAQSLIQSRALANTANGGRTAFDSFKATADIANGVATTKDLDIASQLLRITGQGSASLVSQVLDYRITATVLKAPPGADGASVPTLAAIPVAVTGTFDAPKVRPDLAGIAKAKVKQEIDKHKDEIQEKIQEKLKGLFR